MMKPNTLQRILMDTYRGGEFAHLKRGEDLRECGDTLFTFLYYELDDDVILSAKARGISPALLAVQRLNTALSDIGHVIGVISTGIPSVPAKAIRDTMHV
jgi:hypothetical protein